MFALKNNRPPFPSTASLLPYGLPWAPGVHRLRDGAFTATIEYRGHDRSWSSIDQLREAAEHLNRVFARFNDGDITLHVDMIRTEAMVYPRAAKVLDRTTFLLEEERRQQWENGPRHFESRYFLTITKNVVPPVFGLVQKLFTSKDQYVGNEADVAAEALETFERDVAAVMGAMKAAFPMVRRLGSAIRKDPETGERYLFDELTAFYQWCIRGYTRSEELRFLPDLPPMVTGMIAPYDIVSGNRPVIDGRPHVVIAMEGFPAYGIAGMTDFLNTLPYQTRVNGRYELISKARNVREMDWTRRAWIARSGLGSVTRMDPDALDNAKQAIAAFGEAQGNDVHYGLYTGNIVLSGNSVDDRERLEKDAVAIKKALEDKSFVARIEGANAFGALRSTWPAERKANRRTEKVSTRNFSHLMPTTALYMGEPYYPSNLYPKNSPPLLAGMSYGGTPFRYSPCWESVGMQFISGPIGGGKSTLLNAIAATHLKYEDAISIYFDSGYSNFVTNAALGGVHIDLSADELRPQFAPFAKLRDPRERAWAVEYVELLCALHTEITSNDRLEIKRAVELLATEPKPTFTGLAKIINGDRLQSAIRQYVVDDKGFGILDAAEDGLPAPAPRGADMRQIFTFELGKGELNPKVAIPVISYLMHWIDRLANGRPLRVIFDEAWKVFKHPVWAQIIERWLREMRKQNGALDFATQSIEDAAKSSIADIIKGNCFVKCYMRDPAAARTEAYRTFGDLTDSAIREISSMVPGEVLYTSPYGIRRFTADLGECARALFTATSNSDVARAREMLAEQRAYNEQRGLVPGDEQYADVFPLRFLEYKNVQGLKTWAKVWMNAGAAGSARDRVSVLTKAG